ncbi:hypothetical protein [Aeromonas veronii]|uniref:hypothetical protein n=1 Tax=Aeromonas veronii TaxID=654 RepID=UPI0018826A4E|nr:hypothetical protein [Aeromonas veronii]MBE8841700.1 hypothetical protein [Aeromonas veronii]
MQLNNRWQFSPLLLERLIDEFENMRKSSADGIQKKKLISLTGSLLDGVTDMARLKKALGEGDGTSNALIVHYIEQGLSDDLQQLHDEAKRQQQRQQKEIA